MNLQNAIQLARTLMNQHGLSHIPLEISRGKRQCGYCAWRFNHTTGKHETSKISISRYHIELNDEKEVKETILHEIAHALVPNQGHNWVWRMKAREIGATGKRCASKTTVILKGRLTGTCPKCGKVYYRHRAGHRVINSTWTCKCGGKFKFVDSLNPVSKAACDTQAPILRESIP